jgi:hypothetical protein
MKKAVSSLVKIILGVVRMPLMLCGAILNGLDYMRFRLLDYTPRPDDIFIVTYPRSGTTWMQMIIHQLSSDGNMDFIHISERVPFFERFRLTRKDIDSLPGPRLFKTHLGYGGPFWKSIPKGPCKYIYVARDGRDVATSYYHFYRTHLRFKGTFEDFFRLFMQGRVQYGSWFRHVAGWWAHRNDPNVLFLSYEELLEDTAGSLERIANFCGFSLPPEKMPELLERCSFAYMKKHESKFDHLTEVMWENGLVPESFLRKGKAGEGRDQLSSEQGTVFDQEFDRWLGQTSLRKSVSPQEALSNH